MSAPAMRGESAGVYMLCSLFSACPDLSYEDIVIHKDGRIEVKAVESHGVLMRWSRALPQHEHRTALVPTSYGADEADVLVADRLTVTVRRPLQLNGGV